MFIHFMVGEWLKPIPNELGTKPSYLILMLKNFYNWDSMEFRCFQNITFLVFIGEVGEWLKPIPN
ncbi:MAG: hypothetical protein WAT21_10535, partial [Saprospiraceae bacterium]